MKNLFKANFNISIFCFLFLLASCYQDQFQVLPTENNDQIVDLEYDLTSRAANPSISSIECTSAGGKYFTNDVDYSSYKKADNQGTVSIKIKGLNFGSAAGSLVCPTGYSITNISWTDKLITGTFKCDHNAKATTLSGVKVVTKAKLEAVKIFSMCPFLNTRRYGQCTFHCTKMRLQNNQTVPSPSAYKQTGTIGATFLAQTGDILHWGSAHQAYVTSVVQDTKNKNIYTFYVSEMNGLVGNGTVLTYNYKIEFTKDSKGKITGRKSGNYYSSLYKSTGASSYFR